MNFCSAYLWGKGKKRENNSVSLILQQVSVRGQQILFACVSKGVEGNGEKSFGCTQVSGYFTEALVEWFHRECLELLEKKRTDAELEKSLQKETMTVLKELKQCIEKKGHAVGLRFVGILLVEGWFCLFGLGQMQAFLINRRYNRKHIRLLSKAYEESLVYWESGNIGKKLGILLCTEGFVDEASAEEVAEVLLMEGDVREERLEKRLQELGELKKSKDEAEDIGVVYIQTY